MPTGYTDGILDGTTKDFKDFATDCMRAFGACMHMRDEKTSDPYKKQKVSAYHSDKLKSLKAEMRELNLMSDVDLAYKHLKELNETKDRYEKYIEDTKRNAEKLTEMLNEAKSWTPPSEDHTGIKDFMIQQLADTLNHDGNPAFYSQRLSDILLEIVNIDAQAVRGNKTVQLTKDITYHSDELFKEKERVRKANKWVTNYLNSL